MTNVPTIGQLAAEMRVDSDDVLLALWEQGLTQYATPSDRVFSKEARLVRRILGLPAPESLKTYAYWRAAFGMSGMEFDAFLRDLGVAPNQRARTLPKGAVRRLRAALRAGDVLALSASLQPGDLAIPRRSAEPMLWTIVGTQEPRTFLTAEQIEDIHFAIARDFERLNDPISPAGVRDHNLLASATSRPQTCLGREAKYPTVEMAGAALLHSLVLNHPFHNGNKRTGLVAMLVFLDQNGFLVTCRQTDLFKFVLLIAKHTLVPRDADLLSDREVLAAANWLHDNGRPLDKGERPIQWRRLRHILNEYGCLCSHPSTGNRINIERSIPKRSWPLGTKNLTLRTQVAYRDDGTEADRSTVQKVRRDLHLDHDHDVDSVMFYGKGPERIDEWIGTYRGLLQRLARL